MFRWSSAGALLALACLGCLPDYSDYAPPAPAGDAGCMPRPSGKFVTGAVYNWDTANYLPGVVGYVQGFDCLMSQPSTDQPNSLAIPIPQQLLNDGTEHYVEFTGGRTPILHTIYGPYILDGSEGQDQCVPMHTILDIPTNIRDAINTDLSLTLGQDPYRWIYGSFIDHRDQYRGSKVTISGPVDAIANCRVNYTCEFKAGPTGPCATAGQPFVNQNQDNAYASFFLVTCRGPVTGPVQLSATSGHGASNASTIVDFDPISVPLAPLAGDLVFREWRPHPDGSGLGLPGGCG